jgi:hypothetical protein
MKCVKNRAKDYIVRVDDSVASTMVSSGLFDYCPKSEFKAQQKGRSK